MAPPRVAALLLLKVLRMTVARPPFWMAPPRALGPPVELKLKLQLVSVKVPPFAMAPPSRLGVAPLVIVRSEMVASAPVPI